MAEGPSRSVPTRRRRRQPIVPPQHGAWAFVGLPIAIGIASATWTPWQVVAAFGWILAYPVSYFAIAVLRYPRPGRFVRPLLVWSAAAIPFGVAMLVARPWLVWVAVAYGVALAANVAFARRRDERSLSNDTIFIIECVAIVPVTWGIGAIPGGWSASGLLGAPSAVWVLTGLSLLVLVGSTLHVKSLIRERRDPRYLRWSRVWAAASLVAAVAAAVSFGVPQGLALIVPFAYLLARSLWLADPRMSPGRIGMLELVGFVLLAAAAPVALA